VGSFQEFGAWHGYMQRFYSAVRSVYNLSRPLHTGAIYLALLWRKWIHCIQIVLAFHHFTTWLVRFQCLYVMYRWHVCMAYGYVCMGGEIGWHRWAYYGFIGRQLYVTLGWTLNCDHYETFRVSAAWGEHWGCYKHDFRG
jgi:hypothetical protein